jgi:hypothetical protein
MLKAAGRLQRFNASEGRHLMSHNRFTLVIASLVLAIPAVVMAQEGNGAWRSRAFVNFNIGVQTASPNFGYDYSTEFFDEAARAGLDIPGDTGMTFDIGGGVRLVQNFGVGVTYSRYNKERNGTLSTTVPNPWIYNDASTAERLLPLQRKEDAVHFQAIYKIPVSTKFQLGVFGGPTYFRCVDDEVSQFSLLAETGLTEDVWNVYFENITNTINKESVWGYHAGADVNYLFAKHFGVGGTVRYSEAKHHTVNHLAYTEDLYSGLWGAEDTNVTVDMKHGGLQFNGGVSFRF